MGNFNKGILQENISFLKGKGYTEKLIVDSIDELIELANETGYQPSDLIDVRIAKKNDLDFSGIKMFIMDCDGVLTDGGMSFTENGDEIKRFNVKDGMGIKMLQKNDVVTAIISAGVNKNVVKHRGEMLGIDHVYIGKRPKLEVLAEWLLDLNIDYSEIAYIGDDINDIPVMEKVGYSFCPQDAVSAVKNVVDLVLPVKGGQGCIRALVDQYFSY